MKKIIIFLFIFFSLNSFGKKVSIATLEWPPYISSKIKGNGSVARIITKAFKSVGYEVEFEFLPWARAISYIKSGQVDAIVPIV
jgi:polar amino acid transport system substrate-binding protein